MKATIPPLSKINREYLLNVDNGRIELISGGYLILMGGSSRKPFLSGQSASGPTLGTAKAS